ncbi:MAG: AMP-dependent synthetase [Gammaproteobacteria bacterium]|nr:MAG: AMP-dependent synthetase [Gammaproteobacteria bacterium]
MQVEEFLERSAKRMPDKTALVCDGRRLTYAQLEDMANRQAHALIREGIERGDRVAIYLDNTVEAVISVFGVLKAGGVFLGINPTTKADKVALTLNNCSASALVTDASKWTNVIEVFENSNNLRTVMVTGGNGHSMTGKNVMSLESVLEDHHLPDAPPPKKNIDMDLAALIYTSGSTGRSKGVMLTHLNIVSAATSITSYLDNRPDDVILSALPLSFGYGLCQALTAFQFGGTLVLERSFAYTHAVLETLAREKATGFPIVPTMAAILLGLDLKNYDFSSLRYITNAAAALPTDHIQRLRKFFPHVALYSMYGLTECIRVSYLSPDQIDIRPASVGRAIPNEEVYIVDEENRRVTPGVVGELVVRGANVMKGYWEDPEGTRQRLKPGPLPNECVLHTGDLFRADEEGYLYFVARRDDIIKSRGEKVSPREVEEVLCTHPDVMESAVIGLPDPILGQAICAVISVRDGSELKPGELQAHCKKHLEDFKIPKHILLLQERLQRTPNGKIDKKLLPDLFKEPD